MTALDAFANKPRWLAWRNELCNGRLTKVPYAPDGGKADVGDARTWGTLRAAEARAREIANGHGGGIGVVLGDLGDDSYLCGVDLDSCLDADGEVAPWAEAVLADLDTYCERSPSGTGMKAYFHIDAADVRRFLSLIGIDPDKWGTRRSIPGHNGGNHGPGIEVYCSHRYFAVTKQLFPGKPDQIRPLDWDQLRRLAAQVPPVPRNGNKQQSNGDNGGRDNSRSAKAFREAMRLRAAGKTFEETLEILSQHPNPDIRAWIAEKGNDRQLQRLWDNGHKALGEGVLLEDFYAYMPMHNYIFRPTRATWPAASIDSRLKKVKLVDKSGDPILDPTGKVQLKQWPSVWLDRNRPVEQMTWAPGEPELIKGKLLVEGSWKPYAGLCGYNLYLPPSIAPGNAADVGRWLDHIAYIYPDDAEHIVNWLAHRVQHPEDKLNHALVLRGSQGIGKDTLLAPVRYAIGPWNFQEASPAQILGRFNGFLRSVILRVSEARDLGEFDRFKFYDHMKSYITSPPEVLRIDEKHLREYPIVNVTGIIITTNHKTDGIYLPPDDRRHYVAWSNRIKEDPLFQGNYWKKLWAWYGSGGIGNVAAYLMQRDLSGFDPKAPPPKTAAFWAIADANRAPEEAELADALDKLGNPPALTLEMLQGVAAGEFARWISERRNRRSIPHRLESCGYVPVRNPDDTHDGHWKIHGKRQAVYVQQTLSLRDQILAVRELQRTAKSFAETG